VAKRRVEAGPSASSHVNQTTPSELTAREPPPAPADAAKLANLAVQKGDTLSLVIGRGGSHANDTTFVEFTIAENGTVESASVIKRRLERSYVGVAVVRFKTGRGTYYRVRVKTTEGAAGKLAQRLAGEGYPVIIIRE
jgi:hypothetical protein